MNFMDGCVLGSRRSRRLAGGAALGLALLACAGHAAEPSPASVPEAKPEVKPAAPEVKPEAQPGSAKPSADLVVDAMIGQVNGQALYAGRVLTPYEPELSDMGARLSEPQFRGEARKLLTSRLQQLVFESLLLGEAERDLSENEQFGLRHAVREKHEELVRKHGEGSAAKADSVLRQDTGEGLNDAVEGFRRNQLIRRYLHKKLIPKIVVTRKDIERYYRDHPEEFNKPATRELRLIRVDNEAHRDWIEQNLKDGKDFAEVAADPANTYNIGKAGKMAGKQPGDKVFALDELNQTMMKLRAGRWTGPVEAGKAWWWMSVEAMEPGASLELKEAQLLIERKLRATQYQRLSDAYRARVFAEGSYNNIDEMVRGLVEVAVTRFYKVK